MAAGETLYVLENGEVVRKLAPGESIDNAKFLETPNDWIVGSGTTARIYNDGKQRASFRHSAECALSRRCLQRSHRCLI